MSNRICGTCRWHIRDDWMPDDYYCVRGLGDFAGDVTPDDCTCGDWEGRNEI